MRDGRRDVSRVDERLKGEEPKEIILIYNAIPGDTADVYRMQKDEELYLEERKAINEEYSNYTDSKDELLGILEPMTDKPLDEKITKRYQSLQVEFSSNLTALQISSANATIATPLL